MLGYRRIHGGLLVPGIKVAACTLREILRQAGIDSAPERASATRAGFLRCPAGALLPYDLFDTVTLVGSRLHTSPTTVSMPCGVPELGY